MHIHACRYCSFDFVCNEPADECFRSFITCTDCWKKRDLKYFLLMCAVGTIAIFFTVLFFKS